MPEGAYAIRFSFDGVVSVSVVRVKFLSRMCDNTSSAATWPLDSRYRI
jgi:hypothetical protein